MNPKHAEAAIAWVRQLVDRNQGQLPEWGPYKDHVKAHLNDPYNVPFKMPQEYQYAYLRVKGLSHADAFERMGLDSSPTAASAPGKAKEAWWKFW